MSLIRTWTLQNASILAVLVMQTHMVPAMATANVDQVVPEHDVVPVDDTKFLETSAEDFESKSKCSSYTCPSNYVGKNANSYCTSSACSTNDRPTCCAIKSK